MNKVLLIDFDGIGINDNENGNALKLANMPNFDNFYNTNPHALLDGAENNEIGHVLLGSGKDFPTSESLINDMLLNDNNEVFNNLLTNPNKRVHIIGLCSKNIDIMIKLYEKLVNHEFKNIYFHLITDGVNNTCINNVTTLNDKIDELNVGSIATICGKGYVLDESKDYTKTKRYYDLITRGIGVKVINPIRAIEGNYKNNVLDEFIKPIIIKEDGIIKDGDIIIWTNDDIDSKQILFAFTKTNFEEFPIKTYENLEVYTFFSIDKTIKTNVFIKERTLDNTLGIYLSKLGLSQCRIFENSRAVDINNYFDGYNTDKLELCDKCNIPIKEALDYITEQEMVSVDITKKVISTLDKDYDFILVNYSLADIVGHNGNLDETIKALETMDVLLSKVLEVAEDNFYTVILVSTHGNVDKMLDENNNVYNQNTDAKVPFIIGDKSITLKDTGTLKNIAPTILDYMNIAIPNSMESDSIIIK